MYLIKENDIPLCIANNESAAQELILSLYEEYIYEGWLRQIQNSSDAQLTLMLMKFSTYGYDIFTYERIGLYE